jgi:uncharacterized protein (DUF2062 family)
MLGRRRTLPFFTRLRRALWPQGGWRRQGMYVAHRLTRLPGSPNRIASGFSCGVAVSFTPFVGFHFVLAALLALLVRGNIIASAIGTAAGNPWTFPFIWIWTYKLGRWMLGTQEQGEQPQAFSIEFIFDNPMDVLWPMTVGSLPTGIAIWVAVFLFMRVAVQRYQLRRRRRLHRKLRRKRFRERLKKENEAALGIQTEDSARPRILSESEVAPAPSMAAKGTKP